jgi:hypothetical protein
LRVTVLDDTSVIGAVVVVAEPHGTAVARRDVRLANPELVACSRASCTEFLGSMARLETLAGRMRGERVALYGAGFYGTLVQAHLDELDLGVTAVFDANPRKQGTSRLGLTVRSPAELSSGEWSDSDLVMCINPQIAASVGEKFAPYVRAVHVV